MDVKQELKDGIVKFFLTSLPAVLWHTKNGLPVRFFGRKKTATKKGTGWLAFLLAL